MWTLSLAIWGNGSYSIQSSWPWRNEGFAQHLVSLWQIYSSWSGQVHHQINVHLHMKSKKSVFTELVFCTEEKCDPVFVEIWPSTFCSAFKQGKPELHHLTSVLHLCRWTFWLVKQVWLIVMMAAAHRLQVCRFSGSLLLHMLTGTWTEQTPWVISHSRDFLHRRDVCWERVWCCYCLSELRVLQELTWLEGLLC